MGEQENEKWRKEGREQVILRMLSKKIPHTLEEIAEWCDIELWRVREIKEYYRRNRVRIDYDFMTKDTKKKARDNVRCEFIFDIMKQRDNGVYEETDEYIMEILKLNEQELAEYKHQYLINKNKKKTAEEKFKHVVDNYKMKKVGAYVQVKLKMQEGASLEEALSLYGMTKEEYDKYDISLPSKNKENNK